MTDKKIGFQQPINPGSVTVPQYWTPPQPVNVPPVGPGLFMAGRGLISGVGLAAGLALYPTTPGYDEIPEYWRDPRFWQPDLPGLRDVHPGGFDVVVGDEQPLTPLGYTTLNPNALPDQPYDLAEGGPLRTVYRGPRDRLAGRYIDLNLTDTRSLMDDLPSTTIPNRMVRYARQPALEHNLKLEPHPQGLRARLSTRSVDPKFHARPRVRDQKLERTAYGLILKGFNKTYGTATEVADFLDALRMNSYFKDPRTGEITNAAAAQLGYVELAFRFADDELLIDTVGLAVDFSLQQASDLAYALVDAPAEFARRNSPFWMPYGEKAALGFIGGNDNVLSSSYIPSAFKWLRSKDSGRAARVQTLFAAAS